MSLSDQSEGYAHGYDGRKNSRMSTTPFHLKVFYRVGSFHRLDELLVPGQSLSSPPVPHVEISTWLSCSLRELSHLLVSALASSLDFDVLPSPSVGTRLIFRLVYPDPASLRSGTARLAAKDLGSIVIGGDGMGRLPKMSFKTNEEDGHQTPRGADIDSSTVEKSVHDNLARQSPGGLGGDPDKTLEDARFVTGDFLSVAIVPPDINGDVVGISAATGMPIIKPAGIPGGSSASVGRGRAVGTGSTAHLGGIGGQLPRGGWRRGEELPPLEPRGEYTRERRRH